jgi:hypothetical protein
MSSPTESDNSALNIRTYNKYATEEERKTARRKQKQESKKRCYNHAKFHDPVRYEKIKENRRKYTRKYYETHKDAVLKRHRELYALKKLEEETRLCDELKGEIVSELDKIDETNEVLQ